MDITVSGRHTYVPEAFRTTIEEKLGKVELVAPKTKSISVEVSHENNPKLADLRLKVEITVIGDGPVVRAEAAASEALSAFDLAQEKLMERLRRFRDKNKDHRADRLEKEHERETEGATFDPKKLEEELHRDAVKAKESLKAEEPHAGRVYANPSILESKLAVGESVEAYLDESSPVVIRKKVHANETLTIAEALERMELLGHDFYVFNHASTNRPSVIYRRHGWSYGVIELD